MRAPTTIPSGSSRTVCGCHEEKGDTALLGRGGNDAAGKIGNILPGNVTHSHNDAAIDGNLLQDDPGIGDRGEGVVQRRG